MYSSNMLWRDKSSNIICFPKKLKKVHLVDGGQEVSTASDLFLGVDHKIVSVRNGDSLKVPVPPQGTGSVYSEGCPSIFKNDNAMIACDRLSSRPLS